MVAAAAATGILSLCGSPALADSYADGAATNSPGVASGNALQAPVHVPVNACGNTVDVIAALNPAFGNECENTSDHHADGASGTHDSSGTGNSGGSHSSDGGYGDDGDVPSGAHAEGITEGSPGVGSGNNAQVPVDVPVNLCGNTADVIAALNPVFGNSCDNAEEPPGYGEEEPPPPHEEEPPPPTTPPVDEEEPPPPHEEEPPPPHEEELPPPPAEEHTPPAPQHEQPPSLAETGSEGTLGAAAAGAVLIAGGAILYRRGRALSGR